MRDNADLGIHGELDWAFVLREPVLYVTRLLLRTRASGDPALYRAIMRALLPPADFFVARMMLLTIKQNVERTTHPTRVLSASKHAERAKASASACARMRRLPAPCAEHIHTTFIAHSTSPT
jgi:hypothetical protein